MITFYYANIAAKSDEEILMTYCDKVDKERLSKMLLIKNTKDRVRSLIAGYLLQTGIKEAIGKTDTGSSHEVMPISYGFGQNGKPFLKDFTEIHFNLSHSGDYVACVISCKEVGMDIQSYRNVRDKIALRFFAGEEIQKLEEIKADKAKYKKMFFEIWSAKESYIKYTGMGMSQEMTAFYTDISAKKVIDVDSGDEKAFLYPIENLAGCDGCICFGEPIEGISIREIKL